MRAASNQKTSQTANAARPRIEITPTEAQYVQFCRDLKKLRGKGAATNTEAIIEAVRVAASGRRIRANS